MQRLRCIYFQGYLFPINNKIFDFLIKFSGDKPPLPEEIPNSDEDIDSQYIDPTPTERKGLVNSRIGQGKYRRQVIKKWRGQCAVTGCNIQSLLIASHIIPWRDSTDKQRRDVDNGILLSPVYDALFDKYLISFNDNGKILLSPSFKREEQKKLNISGLEKIEGLNKKTLEYLKHHRERLEK